MSKTAILVDGGFYRKVSHRLWGEHTPKESADALFTYCCRHLKEHESVHELYRIFYYDCPPIDKKVYHPLLGKTVDLKQDPRYKWTMDFYNFLKQKRKLALRLGVLDVQNTTYTLKYDAVKKLCSGTISVDQLTMNDFKLSVQQKGVDMKIGLDISSMAHKKQVSQIVLISNDSDFVPAAKAARREGIDFVLDPLGMSVKESLFEHIDGKRSCGNPF